MTAGVPRTSKGRVRNASVCLVISKVRVKLSTAELLLRGDQRNLVYSQRNRSACVRIPMYTQSPKAKRLEYRPPDPTANPYLAFSAMLQAGLDGIRNKIEPPDPIDRDLYELEPQQAVNVKHVPASLEAVLDALEADHDFLVEGGVFTDDLIETWLDYKRTKEVDQIRLRPHPWEFMLYYDL
jgi:glutamine synthetase